MINIGHKCFKQALASIKYKLGRMEEGFGYLTKTKTKTETNLLLKMQLFLQYYLPCQILLIMHSIPGGNQNI